MAAAIHYGRGDSPPPTVFSLTRTTIAELFKKTRGHALFVGLPRIETLNQSLVGVAGIEPTAYPPHGQILPLYDTPTKDLFNPTLLTGAVHLVTTF